MPKTTATAQNRAQSKDEIDQIMDEIEQLQQEIDATEMPSAKAAPTPTPRALVAAAAAPAPVTEKAPVPVQTPEPVESVVEEEVSSELQELGFGAGDSESSLEETLGTLEEEPSSGTGALDEVDAAVEEEIVEEEDSTVETPIPTFSKTPNESDEAFEKQEITMSTVQKEADTNEGSLTMTLKGNMTLNLQYDIDGQTVSVGFSDGALRVQLADGTEFKIPMRGRRPAAVRRVA